MWLGGMTAVATAGSATSASTSTSTATATASATAYAQDVVLQATPQAVTGLRVGAAWLLSRDVLSRGDHGERPFAIVDKQAALILVFGADGRLAGSAPVLLGRARGDHSAPGVGQRTQDRTLRATDLITPAGRFASEPGRNLEGDDIVWIDYGAALAIHRLRSGSSHADRQWRMASANLGDRRVSAGCVVVPTGFYDSVVRPLLGRQRGVVYVMPEAGDWRQRGSAGAESPRSEEAAPVSQPQQPAIGARDVQLPS